jgi:hypothetical protein
MKQNMLIWHQKTTITYEESTSDAINYWKLLKPLAKLKKSSDSK